VHAAGELLVLQLLHQGTCKLNQATR
jgi:hypothetical protein